jgi:hypothetical protein
MKRFFILALMMGSLLTNMVFAQEDDKGWKKSADFNLAISQNAYSDSWAGGEAGNANWVANMNSLFEGPVSASFFSKSTFKLSFGMTYIQEIDKVTDEKHWNKPVKSTDLIDLESVLSYKSGWFVDPYFAGRFESQFLDASVDSVKRYVNPIKLTESAGFTKRLYEKEKDFIDSRIGFALRENLDRQIFYEATTPLDTVANTEMVTTTDGGIESVTDLSLHLHERIHLTSKLTLNKAIAVSKDAADGWSTLDANWENILAASITKYITVNLYVQWLYDKQVDVRGRLKETLTLGFTYKLM